MAAKKPVPVATEKETEVLTPTATEEKIMTETPATKEIPNAVSNDKALPKDYNEANSVVFGEEVREIKPTKLKYHRNRTAVAYRILQLYPLPDVLSMDKGVLDPDRDGDQILFDFLVAVFDDSKFVQRHYDNMTTADIDRIVQIFCKVNGITEKEEEAKNRQAKGTKA